MIKGYTGFDKRLKYLFDNATEVSYTQTLGSGTPIGSISIDGQSVTIYAPAGGGGSSVSYTPVVNSGEQLGVLTIDGTNHSIYAPTVEANPSGTATSDLQSIQIGTDIYSVSSGGVEFVKATPDMTSNTTPYGVVSASSSWDGSYAPWKAFNGQTDNGEYCWVTQQNDGVGSWIQYQLTEPICIKKVAVSVRNASGYEHAVKRFMFQGSNDGTTWTDIQECTTSASTVLSRSEFYLYNDTEYLYYRLLTLELWDAQDYYGNTAYNQVELYYKQGNLVTDGELDAAVDELQSNFQDGVDDIYDACVAKGSTPVSHALSDVVTAIGNISTGGGTIVRYYPSDLLPTLTRANDSVVTASSMYNSNYAAWKALDNDMYTYWCSETNSSTDWIKLHLSHAVYIISIIFIRKENNSTVFIVYDDDTNTVIARLNSTAFEWSPEIAVFEGITSTKIQNIRIESTDSTWKGLTNVKVWGVDIV